MEAVRLYRVGAALGHAGAQYALAQCLLRGVGVPTPDRSGAVALYTAAAAQDDPHALYSLGNCYEMGAGVARDVVRAVSLWKRVLAHPRCPPAVIRAAAYNLGVVYRRGDDGVARDDELGACYWRHATALGDEQAARALRENGLV